MKIDALCVLGVDREFDLLPERLLSAMDEMDVDRAVISPVDRFLAISNHIGNDQMLSYAAKHPERFIPACSINPWFGQDGIQELYRATKAGARMLILHPFIQGYLANDELVYPCLEAAETLSLPVYIHTGPPGNATPWQIADLAERFPEIDFIMGHCGSTDFWFDANDAALAAENIYLETSLARPFSIPGRMQRLGHQRVIMGSFAPLNDFSFEWQQMERVLQPDEKEDVLGGNLQRLLEKRGQL
jgi:uncharacterized protein